MSDGRTDIELLLQRALAPVDPPPDLELRLERRLGEIIQAAQEELEGWELATMRDPRNWARPAAAAVAGTAAGAALVLLRARRRQHRSRAQSANVFELVERTAHDVAVEARKLMSGRIHEHH